LAGEHPLVEVRGLKMYFPIRAGVLQRPVAWVRAVDDVSLRVHSGEALGLVGESGCGKSTLVRVIVRLYRPTAGQVLFDGQDVTTLRRSQLRFLRRSAQMVFQDPFWSLNPRMRVLGLIAEPLIVHERLTRAELTKRVASLLELVGLSPGDMNRYPHEFSGGQQQRIAIARALATRPRLLLLDEPTSAIDTLSQAQILNLLRQLQDQMNLTYVMVSHDLAVVSYVCHRVAVMYLGQIVEMGQCQEVFARPLHPYSLALTSAVPELDSSGRRRIILPGTVGSPVNPPSGCRFHPRCHAARDVCSQYQPELRQVEEHRWVACHGVGAWL